MMAVTEKELDALRAGLTTAEPADASSLPEMNALAEEIANLRDREKELSDAKKKITEALDLKENRVTEILLENNLTSYKAPAGTMYLAFKTSVRQPQGDERVKFYDWLKKEGRFEEMVSVNSMTLNSFYKEQLELAKETGKSEFAIPGLTEIKVTPTLNFRRTR